MRNLRRSRLVLSLGAWCGLSLAAAAQTPILPSPVVADEGWRSVPATRGESSWTGQYDPAVRTADFRATTNDYVPPLPGTSLGGDAWQREQRGYAGSSAAPASEMTTTSQRPLDRILGRGRWAQASPAPSVPADLPPTLDIPDLPDAAIGGGLQSPGYAGPSAGSTPRRRRRAMRAEAVVVPRITCTPPGKPPTPTPRRRAL